MSHPTDPDLHHSPSGPARRPVTDLAPEAPQPPVADTPPAWMTTNTIVSVTWTSWETGGGGAQASGTLTVKLPLMVPFSRFRMGMAEFAMVNPVLLESTFDFTSKGERSFTVLEHLVVPGATIVLE